MPITAEDFVAFIQTGNPKLHVHRGTERPQIFVTGWINPSLMAEAINLHELNPDFDAKEIVPFLQLISMDDYDEQ